MHWKKTLAAALAMTAGLFAAPAEAATPEEQIDNFLELPFTAGSELALRMRESGYFTLTDLDDDGQLEIFFLNEVLGDPPAAAAEADTEDERAAKREALSRALDDIRSRLGSSSVRLP